MIESNAWKDYELLDCSDGMRLERWDRYILQRPDPQVVWNGVATHPAWKNANAVYHRFSNGGGRWEIHSLPSEWTVSYGKLTFRIRPTGFKHTGLFPEQAANWSWIAEKIRTAGRSVRVLNLFAYTGAATLAAAEAGAMVVHVDASKGMVTQARENAALSGLASAPIRWIVEDCKKFLLREQRRGNRYDGIIMDPPSYGRGPGGEVWKLESGIHELVALAASVLSEEALFFILNSYTTGLSASTTAYLLRLVTKDRGGRVFADELGLPVTQTGGVLPCGAVARWSGKESANE